MALNETPFVYLNIHTGQVQQSQNINFQIMHTYILKIYKRLLSNKELIKLNCGYSREPLKVIQREAMTQLHQPSLPDSMTRPCPQTPPISPTCTLPSDLRSQRNQIYSRMSCTQWLSQPLGSAGSVIILNSKMR